MSYINNHSLSPPHTHTHTHTHTQGVKEVTLLGQNVNSYRDLSETTVPVSVSYPTDQQLSRGFTTIYKSRQGGRRFADLLDKVSLVSILLLLPL